MERLQSLGIALTAGRGKPVLALRALTVLSLAAIFASFLAREFHHPTLADFCGGMAVGVSGALLFIVFSVRPVDLKEDGDEDKVIELKLSR
jgi:hypothetical protein